MPISFNNYTVTDVTINNLSEGDNVSSLYPSAVITLSPNMGYYLDASVFSLIGTPNHIDYATFVQDGPNVICTLYFQAEFIMPAFNVDIPLCIDGSALLTNYTVDGTVDNRFPVNCAYDYVYDSFPVNANYNTYNLCWTASLTADAGFYFETIPEITQTAGNTGIFTIEYNDVFDVEDRLITRSFGIYCTVPNGNSIGNAFLLRGVASEIFVPVEEITGYLIDSSAIPEFGASRTLTIFGSVDTPWVLNCADPILQTGPADPITGLIPYGTSVSGTISSTGSSLLLVNIDAVTVNTVYSIVLLADLSVGFSQPLPIILNQYVNTIITYTTSPYALFVNNGDKYNTGAAYSNPLPGMDGYNNIFNWEIFGNALENDYGIILISQPLPSDFSNLDPVFNGGSSIGINSITAEQTSPGFIEMQITGAVGTYGVSDMITVLDLTKSIAYIDTYGFIDITETTAQSGGEVTYGGTIGTFGMKGLCYSTSALPTVADSILPDVVGFGSFISSLEGLTPSTTYYVRAYGYNSLGAVFYGPEKTFITLAALPLDFVLTKACSGSSLTQIVLDDITGGVGPYYPATDTFPDETSALANTSWSLTSNPGSVAVYYPETVANTYWVAVKDSADTVFTKQIYANCFDPNTATREIGSLSLSSATSSYAACGLSTNPMNTMYTATHIQYTLTVGDVIFTSGSGTTRFDGSNGIPGASNWWKIELMTEISPCPNGTTALVGSDGIIQDLQCCP